MRNERLKSGRNEIDTAKLYIKMTVVCFAFLLLAFLLSRGELFENYFYLDTRDSGMDFFHSIEYVRGRVPYSVWGTLYPPLANALFYFLYLFIPENVTSLWVTDFSESVATRGTNLDLRTYQSCFILYLAFFIICVLLLVFMTERMLSAHHFHISQAVGFCCVASYGVLWAIERGNIILLTALFSLFFVKYRNNKTPIVRELALLALAVAAGLKLYPAVLGVLLLCERKWKEAVRAVFYGVLFIILPFFAFEDGIDGLKIFLDTLASFGGGTDEPWLGYALTNLIARVLSIVDHTFETNLTCGNYEPIKIIVLLIMLLNAIFAFKKEWQRILVLTLVMITYSSQAAYIFCMMLIPLLCFINEEKKIRRSNIIPFIGMAIITLPIPVFNLQHHYLMIVKQFGLILLIMWCIFGAFISLKRCVRKEGE